VGSTPLAGIGTHGGLVGVVSTDSTSAPHAEGEGSTPSAHSTRCRGGRVHAGEVLKARTLGPYPRSSRFDPDRRPCLLDAKNEGSFTCSVKSNAFARPVPERVHGPEALTVERPVETRQEEIRALLGPRTGSTSQTVTAPR
jgi:hypothetical protein